MIKALRIVNDNEVALRFIAKPGQKKEGLATNANSEIVLRIKAPPQEGKANDRIIELLSAILGCRKRNLTLTRGHSSKYKEVRIKELSIEAISELLSRALTAH